MKDPPPSPPTPVKYDRIKGDIDMSSPPLSQPGLKQRSGTGKKQQRDMQNIIDKMEKMAGSGSPKLRSAASSAPSSPKKMMRPRRRNRYGPYRSR
jgi:hypothetical protein